MNRALVIGARGQLGRALLRQMWPDGWTVTALDRAALDLRDAAAIHAAIDAHAWRIVINAAAYTAVDRAEDEVATAWAVNARGPGVLAAACAAAAVPLIHLSTDYVFDGSIPRPLREDDPAVPLSQYGASKLAGEIAVRAAGGRHVILRTAWLIGTDDGNFVTTVRRLAAARGVLQMVDDQYGSPTGIADLAAAVATVAARLADDPAAPTGTFHIANAGSATRHDLATRILADTTARILPIAAAAYPSAARRPAWSVLECSAIGQAYGIVPRHWHAALDDILAVLREVQPASQAERSRSINPASAAMSSR